MGIPTAPVQEFSAPGEVVEIFEDRGERRARIVLRRPAVVDVAVGPGDVHLGDQVIVDGSITLIAIRPSGAGSGLPAGSS